ncbi:MAG: RNA ligase (ATP) [Candidatus Sericytochromatia bacterium]
MSERKLASIQKIGNIEAIAGADAIVRAGVLGWQVVIRKDEFQSGDLCVYCEIDSLLPDKPEFEFLKPRGMRIRTVRLRGQISQGICFPLSVLPEGIEALEGLDVTKILGVVKYEPPIPASLAGQVKGPFPGFIPKTDETRVQVLQPVLDTFAGTPCYVTEKLDGSSVTYYLHDGEFNVCSRNLNLLDDGRNSLWKVARTLEIEAKLRSLGWNACLQGEIIGEGIQGNKYKLKGQSVRFFSLFDIDAYRFLDFAEFTTRLAALDLPTVPVLETDYRLEAEIPALVAKSVGKSVLNPELQREGIVIRPLSEQITALESLGRVSFKAINPEFLLKYE